MKYGMEADFQKDLVDTLRKTRGLNVYRTETTQAGFPDLLVCSGKSHLFIELKFSHDHKKSLLKSFQPAQLPWALAHAENCATVVCLIATHDDIRWLELTPSTIKSIITDGLTVADVPTIADPIKQIKKELGLI